MFKFRALSALLSISFTLAAHAETLQADCSSVSSYNISNGAISGESARLTDTSFNSKNGIVEMKGRRKVFFKGTDRINLGRQYSLILDLKFNKIQPIGDKDFQIPEFRGYAVLKYKNKAVSSGSMSTDQVSSQYIDGTGDKFYQVKFELDNTALREKLQATEQPGLDILDLVRTSPEKAQLFADYGDGNGLLLRVHIICKIPAMK